ncbi:PREDICTED: protein B4-like isoform X1 [Poecilia mexicana]|uniref:protein B4-like isoform X1 n=1 Tax=Poecilia mexicana TaxID=48701 RepID=UPI00072E7BC3|nr:PREDICTED: protein B4-like isoform X1 [Poecilia mexicana]
MPPKKQAADPQPSSNTAPAEEPDEKKTSGLYTNARSVAARKPATHPSTAVMVREALKALDSRKGVSSQAIQNYIKQKYSTVEPVRLKHLVRRILKNGLLNGTLVRPVNATVTTGALGKFRLAPKVKEVKLKSENTDPNVQKPKAGAKKTQTEDSKKKPTNEKAKSTKNPKPPKATKDEAAAPSKVPPAKKPKAKKVEAKGSAAGSSEPTKNKTAKAKGAKTEKKTQSKAVKSGSDAPASKTAGKRVKKAV